MKQRRLIGLAIIAFCVFAGSLLLRRPPEARLYQGKPISAWARQFRSTEPHLRIEAAAAFKTLGTNALPGLIRLLGARDAFLRKQLWALGSKLPASLQRVVFKTIRPPDAAVVRSGAARALGTIGPEATPAIPALVRLLQTDEHDVRWEAARALNCIGGPAVPDLAAALSYQDPYVRYASVCALEDLGSNAAPAAAALFRALEDKSDSVRIHAGNCLTRLGPTVLPVLTNALQSGDAATRRRAAKAVVPTRQPRNTVLPFLLALVHDPDPACRLQAVQTLGMLGLPDPRMVNAFTEALKDPVVEVRLAAVQASSTARFHAALAVPGLTESLDDTAPSVREAAAKILANFGPRAQAASAKLKQLVAEDKDAAVRLAAKAALDRIQPE